LENYFSSIDSKRAVTLVLKSAKDLREVSNQFVLLGTKSCDILPNKKADFVIIPRLYYGSQYFMIAWISLGENTNPSITDWPKSNWYVFLISGLDVSINAGSKCLSSFSDVIFHSCTLYSCSIK